MSDLHDPELEELDQALQDLRLEIRSRFADRTAPAPPWEDVDWPALYADLRRRLSTLGMVERSGEVDEFGMDEVVLRRARPLFELLFERYWRVDVDGLESVRDPGPSLLVANRSGLLPYDGLMLASLNMRANRSSSRRAQKTS